MSLVSSISQGYFAAVQEQATSQSGTYRNSWKTYFMLVGTVSAITGLALSILEKATWQAAIFGGLTIVTAVASYYMRQFAHLADLAATSDVLQKTNDAFVRTQGQLETVNGELETKSSFIGSSNIRMKKTADSLIQSNRDLQKAQKKMDAKVGALEQDNLKLQESNHQLKHQVDAFQQAIVQLKQQVAQFNAQNIQLGRSMGIFKTDVAELNVLELRLDKSTIKFDQTPHSDIQGLAKEIQLEQGLATKFFSDLQTQNFQLQTIIADFSTTIQKGNFSEQGLQELEKLIGKSEENIARKGLQLAQINQQLMDAGEKFSQQQEALIVIDQKLAADGEELNKRENSLLNLEQFYQQMLEQFKSLTHLFEEKVTHLERLKSQIIALKHQYREGGPAQ